MTKCNLAPPISFVGFSHEDTCDIISDHLIKYDIQSLTTFKQVSTTRYIKKVHKIHKLMFPTT